MEIDTIEKTLIERCERLHLKDEALTLARIALANDSKNDLWNGYSMTEIKFVFDCYEYQLGNKHFEACINTKIRLCVEDNLWIDDLKPIGYFARATNIDGGYDNEYTLTGTEKHLADIGIVNHIQYVNEVLPKGHLRRNHIEYEYAAYVSLASTLFISKEFDATGVFVSRAYHFLKEQRKDLLHDEYLKRSRHFLKMIQQYLIKENLASKETIQMMNANSNNE